MGEPAVPREPESVRELNLGTAALFVSGDIRACGDDADPRTPAARVLLGLTLSACVCELFEKGLRGDESFRNDKNRQATLLVFLTRGFAGTRLAHLFRRPVTKFGNSRFLAVLVTACREALNTAESKVLHTFYELQDPLPDDVDEYFQELRWYARTEIYKHLHGAIGDIRAFMCRFVEVPSTAPVEDPVPAATLMRAWRSETIVRKAQRRVRGRVLFAALRENVERCKAARAIQRHWMARRDRSWFLRSRLAESCGNWAEHLEACERARGYAV